MGDLEAIPAETRGREVRRVQDRVYDAVRRRAGLGASHLIVVAVSGGADSLTLLDALLNVRARGGPRLHAAHFNHRIRPESDAIASAAAARMRSLELPVTVGASETNPLRRRPGVSLEMAARESRWRFLRGVAADMGAARIATGHTQDDQVETILMNLARGAGQRGLAGMQPDDGEILRPLLEVEGATVREYVSARGLAPDDIDPSNAAREFRRNRVRHELIPLLDSIYPGARAAIARGARLSGRHGAATELAVASPNGVRMPTHPRRIGVPAGPLADVVREAAQAVRADSPPLNAFQIAALAAALRPPSRGRWVQLPGGLWAFARAGALVLYPERVGETPLAEPLPLAVPGVTIIPGARVFGEIVDRAQAEPDDGRTDSVHIDGDRLGAGALIRGIAPEERFRPLGAARERDLIRFLAGRGVPAPLRASTPVVTIGGAPAWVVGAAIAHDFAVRPGTRRIVRLDVAWDRAPPPSDARDSLRNEPWSRA